VSRRGLRGGERRGAFFSAFTPGVERVEMDELAPFTALPTELAPHLRRLVVRKGGLPPVLEFWGP